MLQSHLLQVLAVAGCEAPATVDATDFRDATAAVLRATRLWDGPPVLPNTDQPSRRARYTAGDIGDRHLPSYVDEEGVDPSRETETLAEFVVEVRNARWAGVPFILRSGKAIGKPTNAVVVRMKPVRHSPTGQVGEGADPEQVTLGFKPPSIAVRFTAEGADLPFELEVGDVEGDLPKGAVTEYGEVLRGILGDDPTLSVRGDVAEQCWRIVQPVLDAWAAGEVPLDEYPAGSAGPSNWS
jgi:glucose-6-phosphate 1-dehydrogenase